MLQTTLLTARVRLLIWLHSLSRRPKKEHFTIHLAITIGEFYFLKQVIEMGVKELCMGPALMP